MFSLYLSQNYVLLPGEETSSNPTTSTPTCAISNCSTGIRFFSEDSQICLGTFLGSGWVLTSASCALR